MNQQPRILVVDDGATIPFSRQVGAHFFCDDEISVEREDRFVRAVVVGKDVEQGNRVIA